MISKLVSLLGPHLLCCKGGHNAQQGVAGDDEVDDDGKGNALSSRRWGTWEVSWSETLPWVGSANRMLSPMCTQNSCCRTSAGMPAMTTANSNCNKKGMYDYGN
jgi:hypothetical protein